MDYATTAIELANRLFVQPNATATVDTTDLEALAQLIDQALPDGTTDGATYIDGIRAALSGNLLHLSAPEVAAAIDYIVLLRNPPAAETVSSGAGG